MEKEIRQVRHLIPDLEALDWEDAGDLSTLFTDEQIQTYLEINEGNVKRAAALAVRALAVSEGIISKVIKTEDLQTDGAKLTRALRDVARDLEESADEDEDRDSRGFFFYAPFRPAPPNRGWRPYI